MAAASRLGARLIAFAPHLAHLLVVLALFAPLLFEGRMLFHRDVSTVYYPDYVFLARSLAEGVWPLWNPAADAGAPFFMPYPVTVLLAGAFGPRAALALSPPLHVLLAMCGGTLLARACGGGRWGAWAAGATLGLSGYVLSTLLYPVFLASAWAPLIAWAWWRLQEAPTGRRVALLAALGALQVSTLGAEVVAQTAFVALLLRPPALDRRRLLAVLATLGLALLLAAPVLLGGRATLEGTPRGKGFSVAESLSFSAPPIVQLEALLPRFLGDVHAFTDVGFWGQPFFPEGYPFLMSPYLGLPVLALALLAGRDRLWIAAALGVLASLGAHGPLAEPLALALGMFRVPIKFFFLTTFAVALLAGRGLDRALRSDRVPGVAVVVPSLVLLPLLAATHFAPESVVGALRWWHPEIVDWKLRVVVLGLWPGALLRTAALGFAFALALRGGRATRPLAAVAAAADLLVCNGGLNPAAPAAFYELRGPTRAAVVAAEAEGRYRWFSCGLIANPPVRFQPAVIAANRDVDLYALDRQALLPRTHVLDGLEGALDEDRTGLLPVAAALQVPLRDPSRIGEYRGRLRLANVKWVVSWRELPSAWFVRRTAIHHPEVLDEMGIYELRDALPRAFWVGQAEVIPEPARRSARIEDASFDPARTVLLGAPPPPLSPAAASGVTSVVYQPLNAHTVRLEVDSPPGLIVVLDGFHKDWQVEGGAGVVPLLEANGGYRAIPTPGGRQRLVMSYRPSWLPPALGALLSGIVIALAISKPIKTFRATAT